MTKKSACLSSTRHDKKARSPERSKDEHLLYHLATDDAPPYTIQRAEWMGNHHFRGCETIATFDNLEQAQNELARLEKEASQNRLTRDEYNAMSKQIVDAQALFRNEIRRKRRAQLKEKIDAYEAKRAKMTDAQLAERAERINKIIEERRKALKGRKS